MERLSVKQAADFLKVSEKTVYRWIRQGVIPTTSSQGRYRFNRKELEAWARYKRIGVDASALDKPDEGEDSSDLLSAIGRGGVFHDLQGKNIEEIFSNAVNLVPSIQEMDEGVRESLIQELVERESLVSTGVGNGVALPHPRHPRDWGTGPSTVAFFFLKRPIDLNAIDGKPVQILVLLLCQSVKIHLQILSEVAHLLKDAGLIRLLKKKPSADELLEHIRHAWSEKGE